MKARPKTAHGVDFRSTTEANFAAYLEGRKPGNHRWYYEPVKFQLVGRGKSGVAYTPDFMVVDEDRISFYEVKGSWRARGASSTRKSLKMAAALYPMFYWYGVNPVKKGWHIEEFVP